MTDHTKIFKYRVSDIETPLQMPRGAIVLSAGVQGTAIMVWAKVDPEAELVTHKIHVYGTGHEIANSNPELSFIGTVFMDVFVFHVFDAGEQ